MAAVVARRVRTTQPQSNIQIDWGNPLTAGLVFAYTMSNEAQGWGEDGRNGIQYVQTSDGVTPYGKAVNTPTGTGGQLLSSSSPYLFGGCGQTSVTAGKYSLFAFGTGPASGIQSAIDDDNGTTRRFQFRINAGKVELNPFYSGGNGNVISPVALSASDLASGFAMGATVNGTAYAIFQKGAKTTGTPMASTALAPTNSIAVGARKTGTSQQWLSGGLMLVAMWNRPLTDAEHASLADSPWQLFRAQPTRRLWLAWSASSGTTVSAGTAAVSIAGLPASVSAPTNIAAAVAATLVQGQAAQIVTPTNIAAALAAVSVTGQAAQIVTPTAIAATVAGVAVAGLPAQIVTPAVVACGTGAVQVAGQPATISSGNGIACTTAAVSVQGLPASITTGAAINCVTAAVNVSGLHASVSTATTIACGVAAVSVAGMAATIAIPTDISARAGAVAVAGQAAQIVTTAGIPCATARVSIAGWPATITSYVPPRPIDPEFVYTGQPRQRAYIGAPRQRGIN